MEISNNMRNPWMLAGDFNDITYVSEKKGGVTPSLSRCKRLRDRMELCRVSDVESRRPIFTWRGPIYRGGQRIYEKLDRALSNDEWRMRFPDSYVKVLMRVDFSDHHPILINLKEDNFDRHEKHFRFENAWLTNDTYGNMLRDVWKEDKDVVQNLKNVVDGIDN
ncbi:uncharacterized protein LOC131648642 [Vicia villosa]|uniref:uncharacterized protein LOC131648642 n=1 Tax=Vicia villosa TaxID=3911 RepID=UPI00273B059B|nr:uncharacterized protein LOC131648642 [Vicia villosa]